MFFRLFARGNRQARAHKPRVTSYFRPRLEGFEERVVPAAPVFDMGHVAQIAPAAAPLNLVINSVNLTNLQIVDNVLTAAGTVTGTLAGLPFTTDITNFTLQLAPDDPDTDATECSVLHLELAPIHLALLGLHVDTSRICLDITATEGGGILGDLLCGLAGGGVLPTATQLTDLQNGLTGILGQALGGNASPAKGGGDSVCTGQCEVLDLSLGPVNLSLLGLNVSLDDCEGGPVQVCVSATRSEGLLGSLLCGLSGGRGRNFNLDIGDLTQLVGRVTDLLGGGGDLSGQAHGQLTSFFAHLKP